MNKLLSEDKQIVEETKQAIRDEYNNWFQEQYGNVDKKKRKELGAVFTPPDIAIGMVERLGDLEGDILDPSCGSGNLLAACMIAGAEPKHIFGNEYEEEFLNKARERLTKIAKHYHPRKKFNPMIQLHQGDATKAECIKRNSFSKDYKWPKQEEVQISLW